MALDSSSGETDIKEKEGMPLAPHCDILSFNFCLCSQYSFGVNINSPSMGLFYYTSHSLRFSVVLVGSTSLDG